MYAGPKGYANLQPSNIILESMGQGAVSINVGGLYLTSQPSPDQTLTLSAMPKTVWFLSTSLPLYTIRTNTGSVLAAAENPLTSAGGGLIVTNDTSKALQIEYLNGYLFVHGSYAWNDGKPTAMALTATNSGGVVISSIALTADLPNGPVALAPAPFALGNLPLYNFSITSQNVCNTNDGKISVASGCSPTCFLQQVPVSAGLLSQMIVYTWPNDASLDWPNPPPPIIVPKRAPDLSSRDWTAIITCSVVVGLFIIGIIAYAIVVAKKRKRKLVSKSVQATTTNT